MSTSQLTPEQQDAVDHEDGSQVLTACPGSGKTRVVVARIKALREKVVDRRAIAVISFTNAAVDEISERLDREGLGAARHHPNFIGTFDQFVNRFLVQPFGHPQCPSAPHIIESWSALGIAARPPRGERGQPVTLDALDVRAGGTVRLNPERIADGAIRSQVEKNPKVWEQRTKALRSSCVRQGLLTCADARQAALERLQGSTWRAALGAALSARFRELIVDEAQDSNEDDVTLLEWLRDCGIPMTVVWDPDQAIFGFRDSDGSAVRRLTADFTQRSLTGNFRSSPAICEVAATLRSRRIPDTALGPHARLKLPVTVVSYAGDLQQVGRFYHDQVVGLGLSLENSAVLAHQLRYARESLGLPATDDHGTSKLLRLLVARNCYAADEAIPGERERALVEIERLLLGEMSGVKNRPVELLCDNLGIERRWIRRLALQVAAGLPILNLQNASDVKQWAKAARDFIIGLDLTALDGKAIGQGWPAPKYDKVAAMKGGHVAGLSARTVHSAKGKAFDSVLLVIPKGAAGRTDDLVAAWKDKVETDAKKVLFVGATRAERLLTIAVPRAFERRVVGILKGAGAAHTLVQLPAIEDNASTAGA